MMYGLAIMSGGLGFVLGMIIGSRHGYFAGCRDTKKRYPKLESIDAMQQELDDQRLTRLRQWSTRNAEKIANGK